jgi:ppGpp synthetase/RelA/SpoT-type nucleotidyltranferase
MARPKRCFLSSTLEDLRGERLAVRDAIDRAGFRPLMMESFTTDTRPPAELLVELVDSSVVMLLVLGARLGSRDPSSRKYFVQIEYERAREAGLQIHVFLSTSDRLIPEGQRPPSQREQKDLAKFRSKLQAEHTVRTWKTTAQLEHEVFVALSRRRPAKRRSPPKVEPTAPFTTPSKTIEGSPEVDTTGPTASPLSPIVDYLNMVRWYEDNLFAFDEVRQKLERHVRSILLSLISNESLSDYSVYSRTKKPSSLQGNLERPKPGRIFKEISDVHDLVGLRVVVLHESEVGKVCAELLGKLPGSSLESKGRADPLSFGYRSDHILSPYPESIAKKSGFRYEIQIRTFLQHTWAQVEHQLGYKATVYDDTSRRLFAQVSALLEIADGKFSELKQRQQPAGKPPSIEKVEPSRQRRSADRTEIDGPVLLTQQAISDYFAGHRWDSAILLEMLLSRDFAFAVDTYDNGHNSSKSWGEPLFLLGASDIATIDALHDFLNNNAARLAQVIGSIGIRIEFTEVSPLLLLWVSALAAHADGMKRSPVEETRALLDQYGLFPEDDRDAIADLIAIKPYLQ